MTSRQPWFRLGDESSDQDLIPHFQRREAQMTLRFLPAGILPNAGLPELIAETPERCIQIAASLASDTDRLASLRRELRHRLTQSQLMDARGFVRDLEQAYRHAWREWCGTPTLTGDATA